MFWPWQIISKFLSINFTHKLEFNCDHKKILDEYYSMLKAKDVQNHPGTDHKGGWDVVSLYSQDGDSNSVFKKYDKDTIPTDIINFFPYTNSLIQNILNKYEFRPRRIRFSILRENKKITWHKDWDESIEYGNCRLHLPLIINNNCWGKLSHQFYNWLPGELWYGDYTFPHQVINNGNTDRVHLVLDFTNAQNLFNNDLVFIKDEQKRKRYKKIIIFLYNFFYYYPKRILNRLTINKLK